MGDKPMAIPSGTRFGLIGAGGRMGIALIQTLMDGDYHLIAACDRADHPAIDRDIGHWAGREDLGIAIISDPQQVIASADVILDFSARSASVEHARLAAEQGKRIVIGTTGFTPQDDAEIALAAQKAAIVKSGNYSVGITVLTKLIELTARALPGFDLEIVEMHHKHKIDAPSGTALMMGKAAAAARGIDLADHLVMNRQGHTGPRIDDTIGFQSLRGGSVIGDHTLIAAGPSERIEIRHIAEDRTIFAKGAVAAALWLSDKPPGLYDMNSVLGL